MMKNCTYITSPGLHCWRFPVLEAAKLLKGIKPDKNSILT